MTLFLLLVTIAAIAPPMAVAVEASHLSSAAMAVGELVAVMLAVLQIVGHHRIAARISTKGVVAGVPAATAVAIYYVGIVLGGITCAMLAQTVARAW